MHLARTWSQLACICNDNNNHNQKKGQVLVPCILVDCASSCRNSLCACCAGGPTPKDISTALADAQAAHDAAKAGLHAHALAAIENMPSLQQSPAANDPSPALDDASIFYTSAAGADATLETEGVGTISAAVAEAVLEINGVDSASAADAEGALMTDSIDTTSAAVAEADPFVKHAVDAATTARNRPPQQSDSSFLSVEAAEIDCKLQTHQCHALLEGERLSDEDSAHAQVKDATPSTHSDEPPCEMHGTASVPPPDMLSLCGVEGLQKQQQSAKPEADMAEDSRVVDASLPPTGSMHSRLVQSQSEAKRSLPHDSSLSVAALDQMLELQLQRIKDSAVMLPEPAEILVTDLFDHRWLRCCAVLCCAMLCCAVLNPRVPSCRMLHMLCQLCLKPYACMTPRLLFSCLSFSLCNCCQGMQVTYGSLPFTQYCLSKTQMCVYLVMLCKRQSSCIDPPAMSL